MQGSLNDYKEHVIERVRELIDHYVPIQKELKILITFNLNEATVKYKGEPHSKLAGENVFRKADEERQWEYRRERKNV